MKIGYASKKLHKACTQEKDAKKHLSGSNVKPKHLFQRLAELAAFENLGQVPFQEPPLHFHPLRGDRAGEYAVTIRDLWRITFTPAGEFERKPDGSALEESVTEIVVRFTGDYHSGS